MSLVSGVILMGTCSSTEFDLHIFKRRASGQERGRYTIGVWESTHQRAICHDACIDCALAAVRAEMEKAGQANVSIDRTEVSRAK